ncbi:hypothetical protein C8R30_12710 [Nitrosomonas nitrosa]|nr:hypothetical protein C8R30_12710 [Nitrosomonas nitrosa]
MYIISITDPPVMHMSNPDPCSCFDLVWQYFITSFINQFLLTD